MTLANHLFHFEKYIVLICLSVYHHQFQFLNISKDKYEYNLTNRIQPGHL